MNDNIARYFTETAGHWVDTYRGKPDVWYRYNTRRWRERHALAFLEDVNRGTVLDIGCGPGHALIELKKIGFSRLIGVDISERMLVEAERLFSENGLSDHVDLYRADAQKMNMIESGSVDACLALGVLEYMEDDESMLREVYRILRPNGTAVIQVRNRQCIASRAEEAANRAFHRGSGSRITYREHTAAEFRRQAAICGFEMAGEAYSHFYALFPFDIYPFFSIPIYRHIIEPFDSLLSQKLEALSRKSISRYLASMYIAKMRKVHS